MHLSCIHPKKDLMWDQAFYCWWSASHSLKMLCNAIFQGSGGWDIGSNRWRIGKGNKSMWWLLCTKYLCCIVAFPPFLQNFHKQAVFCNHLKSNIKTWLTFLNIPKTPQDFLSMLLVDPQDWFLLWSPKDSLHLIISKNQTKPSSICKELTTLRLS